MDVDPLIPKALTAKRESKRIEFKGAEDFGVQRDCCELIKDLVAIANTGGGVILFGVSSAGVPLGVDLAGVRSVDPAVVADRIHKYTGTHFAELEVHEVEKDGHSLTAWLIGESPSPIAFTKPGTYALDEGSQKTAFAQGTVYFRHGAKSEPGTTADIASALERRLERLRSEWLRGVRKVIHAPAGAQVVVGPAEVRESSAPDAAPIRVTDDPSAPAYRVVDPDQTHPHRQKELVALVRGQLPSGPHFNQYDVQALRRLHAIEGKREFAHKPKFGSLQYSDAFVSWIVQQVTADPDFLSKARTQLREGE